MRTDSSLTEVQRATVVALFEAGHGPWAVATRLRLSRDAIKKVHDRWRIRGRNALVPQSTKRSYAFELKVEVVQRFLAGETKLTLAQEFGLSSPQLVGTWARMYRREGEDGLRPKPQGRPKANPDAPARPLSELEQLRRENERLRAEVAYLGKLRALTAPKRR